MRISPFFFFFTPRRVCFRRSRVNTNEKGFHIIIMGHTLYIVVLFPFSAESEFLTGFPLRRDSSENNTRKHYLNVDKMIYMLSGNDYCPTPADRPSGVSSRHPSGISLDMGLDSGFPFSLSVFEDYTHLTLW